MLLLGTSLMDGEEYIVSSGDYFEDLYYNTLNSNFKIYTNYSLVDDNKNKIELPTDQEEKLINLLLFK